MPDVDQDNNILAVPITLNPQCVDDDARTNESPDTATDLSDAPMARREGVICPFTEDWYLLPANAGNVSIQLETMVGQGDLDIEVIDANTDQLLGVSRTENDVEMVQFELQGNTNLLIRIDGFDAAANQYTLTWSLP